MISETLPPAPSTAIATAVCVHKRRQPAGVAARPLAGAAPQLQLGGGVCPPLPGRRTRPWPRLRPCPTHVRAGRQSGGPPRRSGHAPHHRAPQPNWQQLASTTTPTAIAAVRSRLALPPAPLTHHFDHTLWRQSVTPSSPPRDAPCRTPVRPPYLAFIPSPPPSPTPPSLYLAPPVSSPVPWRRRWEADSPLPRGRRRRLPPPRR